MIFDTFHDGDFHMMDWLFSTFGPYSWLIMVLGISLYIIFSVTIAYYVHKDAIRRGIVNSEVWLIVVLIFNVIGLLLYLLVRGNYTKNQSKVRTKEYGNEQ
ncbi:MAG: PLDc N-terminal domain-containing protein [Promethearchaeota archaeon]